MQAHLAQIERMNPSVNAIVTLVAEQALAGARRADDVAGSREALGPLQWLADRAQGPRRNRGHRTTFGSPIFKDNVPASSALHIRAHPARRRDHHRQDQYTRIRRGLADGLTQFRGHEKSHDLTKTCGGSSGVAAGRPRLRDDPIADGSDFGGSLRNPAAFWRSRRARPSPGRVPHSARGLAMVDALCQRSDGAQCSPMSRCC